MKQRTLFSIYGLILACLTVFCAYTLSTENRLHTDLGSLLPHESHTHSLLQAADRANEQQLNQNIVLLIGNAQAEQAFTVSEHVAQMWQKSGLFSQIEHSIQPDLNSLQNQAQNLGLATMPRSQSELLQSQASLYFQQRAESILNPFQQTILPADQDWLGLTRFLTQQSNPSSQIQWNAETGQLFSVHHEKTWVWLRATLPEQNLQKTSINQLINQTKQWVRQQNSELLISGGILFALATQEAAEQESSMMSVLGLSLTFAFLYFAFRSKKLGYFLIPLGTGLLCGLAATLLLNQHIHILTLVIGTSLMGMLIDFPLHWLASSLFVTPHAWQATKTMKRLQATFLISLSITALGYALLWFTPLPILQETAIFSTFALLGAFFSTRFILPQLFTQHTARHTPFSQLCCRLTHIACLRHSYLLLPSALILLIFTATGIQRSQWQDDIRQWANMPQQLIQDSKQISQISGTDWGTQYFVVEGKSNDDMLHKTQALQHKLEQLIQQKQLNGIQALSQVALSTAEQQNIKNTLHQLQQQTHTWSVLLTLGATPQQIQEAFNTLIHQPNMSLESILQHPLMQAWQPLYLGEVAPQRFASMVRLNGVNHLDSLLALHQPEQGIYWSDRRTRLNQAFEHTRNQAILLKLGSFVLAFLVLWKYFGIKKSILIISIPLIAILFTIALLAWLDIPISLFVAFGLLLTAAIGIDYTVYTLNAPEHLSTRLCGITLAAITTSISFSLLSFSSTPAIMAFGLSVFVGTVFNLILNYLLIQYLPQSNCSTQTHH